ncbi:MAG: WXG100 family type VII secretion target [Mogibacterium sp.]|nr:WXG100 family type VII secretion target [Mogibacterium sp.]
MADLIKVNTNRLDTDLKEFGDHIKAIQKAITDLRNHNRVLDGMWDGPASEAFKINFESDIKAMEEVVKTLEGINRFEENARTKYNNCESKVGDLVNQIHVR